jgi:hypothetical protein
LRLANIQKLDPAASTLQDPSLMERAQTFSTIQSETHADRAVLGADRTMAGSVRCWCPKKAEGIGRRRRGPHWVRQLAEMKLPPSATRN